MANIKLKDLLKEMRIAGGVVSESPWAKTENDTPQINIKELVSSIKNYGSLGEHIYGKGSLKEVAETPRLISPQSKSSPAKKRLFLKEKFIKGGIENSLSKM